MFTGDIFSSQLGITGEYTVATSNDLVSTGGNLPFVPLSKCLILSFKPPPPSSRR